ncbi:nucleotidyltransferase family protein [Olivibacter sp. SDN3]|uniref:nucleotidyltransferase family protein n=1 Tax=Olivibacter sp. SDN3 TaxID=2764720 RepID=UPI0016517178|nr:nucleotidyltransferase family protein [Olivibacter sp. SDN3]QNL50161.1 nucleotidyltransferase family protein [Olivibacter sp. SDN3]
MESTSNDIRFGIIIIAAGMSRRLGTLKQLLSFKGNSLLMNTVLTAKQVKTGVTVVVLGAQAELLKKQIRAVELDVLVNGQYQEGMASSIRCGVQHVANRYKKVEGVVIMVCDQPYVDHTHVEALIEKSELTNAKVVASTYAGRKGVPAFFAKDMFPVLAELKGDIGAKYILRRRRGVATVAFPLGHIDIDTKEAYEQLLETTTMHNREKR